MADFTVKKGLNIPLAGKPSPEVSDALESETAVVYPLSFGRLKPRLVVKEGAKVKRGDPLFIDKQQPELQFTAPAAGTVETIIYGHRRVIEQVIIRKRSLDDAVTFSSYSPEKIKTLGREKVMSLLLESGMLALLQERPFSRIPRVDAAPKSIFVNAMDTAPHHTDVGVAVKGHEAAFQAGLDALGGLTDGSVHLVLPAGRNDLPSALIHADDVEIHTVSGPHPAGNSSVHVHLLDPIVPGDVVWTIRAQNVVPLGHLLLEGTLPKETLVALSGPGIIPAARKHYRVSVGAPLTQLLGDKLTAGEKRIINGDALSGTQIPADSHLPYGCSGLTVIDEDRSRTLLGWLAPGWGLFSASRTFLSTWFNRNGDWALGSSQNGSLRAMVLTGLYDKYMPMQIMVDYLVRSVIANDTDEAIQLGILETDPEDFALCAFACPSKMDIVGIMRRGLEMIEEEGI
jgi:Na+-transporting NADH:ubiquinone oxidoreductase subunit A